MKGLGWRGHIRSIKDQRYALKNKLKGIERPKVKELWYPLAPDCLDQGDLGSCGPHAAVTLMHSVMIQNNMAEWSRRSPLALYFFYRDRYGHILVDDGVYNRELLQVMVDRGVPAESIWPYDEDMWKLRPLQDAYVDAENHQILEYHAVEGLEEMLQCLAEDYAFMGGIPVYQSFVDVGSAGLVPMPGKGDPFLGGHDLYFCGYDDHRKVLYGLNSWGTSWGKNGRFDLPYEYAATMLDGCYAITLQEG